MSEHFNRLTPAEDERLAFLSEECAEVIQIIGKIQRHGYDSMYPPGVTNRALLMKELGHVHSAIERMLAARDIAPEPIHTAAVEKMSNPVARKYFHHQD